MKTVDLHVHSNFSDGTLSPAEIVALAVQKGLSAIALTDHDTVSGVGHALQASKQQNIPLEVIPGIELSADYQGNDIHIVGLFLDYKNQELLEKTALFTKRRANRNAEMAERLQKAGIPITLEAMKKENPDTVITRAHFAKFLVSHNIVQNPKDAFTLYLNHDTPYYVPRVKMSGIEAIRLILQADGIPVLAHPMHYKLEESILRKMIIEFKDAGLAGIEVKYSNHTEKEEAFVQSLSREYNLLASGGSDFHGSNKPAISLGNGRGTLAVPYEYLEKLIQYKNQKNP